MIPGRLPCLNDYLIAARGSKKIKGKDGNHESYYSNDGDMKKKEQKRIVNFIRMQLRGRKISPPLYIHYHYFEKDKYRDPGNIHAVAQKFIEDALQDAKAIPNDGWDQIIGFSAEFDVDKKNPRIEVTLTEVERK